MTYRKSCDIGSHMTENRDDSLPDVNRRTFMKGLAVTSAVGYGVPMAASRVRAETSGPYVLEQGGKTFEIQPLTHDGLTIEEFYDHRDGSAHTATGLESVDASQLFLWNGPDGLSLVTLHGSGTGGGEANFTFTGLPGESGTTVFTDDFEGGIGAWETATWGGYNGDVTADDGRMRLRVYRCHNAQATHDLGTHSGTLRVSFDWEVNADQWWEHTDWALETADGQEIPYTVVSGQDVPRPGYRGDRSGSVTVEAEVDGPVRVRFYIEPSSYCSNFDHADTYLWVDDVEVASVTGISGEWVVQDDPDAFDSPADPNPTWAWSSGETDGGAFQGGLQEAGEITIEPSFSGVGSWQVLTPQEVTKAGFKLHNSSSSSSRTTDWQEIEVDLSAFAGSEITIELDADGRHTYNYENTTSWIKAGYVRIDGILDENFEDLTGWECTNLDRSGNYNDTPTKGFCRAQDGSAYVQEETNRRRTLSRTVKLPADGTHTLRARVRGHISAAWSTASLSVTGPAGAADPERHALDPTQPATLRFGPSEGPDTSPIQEKLTRKNNLIDTIRANAGEVIGQNVATAQLETTADEFLSTIETTYEDADEATINQYDEALSRMLQVENITSSAVDSPKPVIRKTVKKGVAIAASLAISKGVDYAGSLLGGVQRLARWGKSLSGSPISQSNRIKRLLLGLDFLPYSLRNDAVDALITLENRIGKFLDSETNREQVYKLGKTAAGKGINAAAQEAAGILDDLTGIVDDVTDELVEILYEMYLFSDTLPQVELPVDVTWIDGVSQALQYSPSIDSANEKQVDDIRNAANASELTSADRQVRQNKAEAVASYIISVSDDAEGLLDTVEEEIEDQVSAAELFLIGGAGIFYGLDILAGGIAIGEVIALASVAGLLVTLSELLGAVALVLATAQALAGVLFFMFLNKVHAFGTFGIANYELIYG